MYREVETYEVLYGHWNDAVEAAEEINTLCRERGLLEARLLVPSFGKANKLIVETEYDELAQWTQQRERFYADAEIMKAVRKFAAVVAQGSGGSELLQNAPHVA